MATSWGAPDVIVERFIDEFGVVRPTEDFLQCRRIAVRVVVDRLPYNYYTNNKNRQPANSFFGKITVFSDGYLREEHDITHEYCEFDIDTDILVQNDAYLGIVCRQILSTEYLRRHFFALSLSHPSIPGGLATIPDFRTALNQENGEDLPLEERRYPTKFISYPRFDEVRLKFIEPQMRGKLILVGWLAVNRKTCCSTTSEPPEFPPDEPPKDPPLEAPPFPPDTPDDELPIPTPPYDDGDDDGRSKPPPEEPPTGNDCQLYSVTIRIKFGASSGFQEQDEVASIWGPIGDARIVGVFPPGTNVELKCRGNNSIGQPCGEFQYYPFTGFSGIEIVEIISVSIA